MKHKNILPILIAFLMLSSIASAVEIRGTVVEDAVPHNWTAQEFAGFYYDLDKGQSFETLNILGISDRTIPIDNLVYETKPISVNFSYSDDKNLPVFNNKKTYDLVGWQAEKWVALNGRVNKLVKLMLNTEDDKVSLQSGGTLTLGNGYVIKINSVDANAAPRQAWISVLKDGSIIDDTVVQQGSLYNLQKNVGTEKDVLVLSAFVSSIFAGQETQMIQFQYIWFIDESTFTEVTSGSSFGVFKASVGTDSIMLKNPSSVTLSRDSDIDLMGNMKFKVADSDILRFYPYVNIVEINIKDTTPVQTITVVNNTSVPCTPTIVERIVEVEKIVYVTPTPTLPAPTVTSTPGFEGIFAIIGLVSVLLLIVRKRK